MNSNTSIKFPVLTTERYEAAVEKAKKLVQDRLRKPELSDFSGDEMSSYPRWLIIVLLALLVVVMTGSFIFSAGKQVAVVSLLIDELPSQYHRLSDIWSGIAIGSTLLVSELGSVLFLVSAGVFSETSGRVAGIVLRLFAVGCASLAIMCNIAVAAIDTPANVAAVGWFVSFLIPSIVLGLGVILEQVVLSSLKARLDQRAQYELALRDYRAAIGDPAKHIDYGSILTPLVFEEMIRRQRERETITVFVTSYGFSIDMPDVQARLVHAEIDSHTSRNALTITENPFVSDRFRNNETLMPGAQTGVIDAGVSAKVETLPPAVEKAVAWLREHPETETMKVRQVAALAGMSPATIQLARQVLK